MWNAMRRETCAAGFAEMISGAPAHASESSPSPAKMHHTMVWFDTFTLLHVISFPFFSINSRLETGNLCRV